MKALKKKRGVPKLPVLSSLALCAAVIFLTANIPALSEYFFARGITRGINWVLTRIVNLIPASLYEVAAEFLIRLIGKAVIRWK